MSISSNVKDSNDHPMNAFLCSSMNMELVCAILQGVKDTMKQTMIDVYVSRNDTENLKVSEFQEVTSIKLKTLEMMNPEEIKKQSIQAMNKF
jgi:hypothetical protein